MTAGSGIEGAGEAIVTLTIVGTGLCEVGGGCMVGRASDCGVPGIDGTGEPMAIESATKDARPPKSGGAGLFEDTRRAGRSILVTLLCCANEN